jgi:hypothetical protein
MLGFDESECGARQSSEQKRGNSFVLPTKKDQADPTASAMD